MRRRPQRAAADCLVMDALSNDRVLRWAVALLVGAVLTSRSPASAISIVGEMRANGDFTKTSLGVTIFMYVAVVVVVSITQAISVILVGAVDGHGGNATALASPDGAGNATAAAAEEEASAGNVALILIFEDKLHGGQVRAPTNRTWDLMMKDHETTFCYREET